MPSYDKTRKKPWRGVVRFNGERHRKDFRTKREAVAWEAHKRVELEGEIAELPAARQDQTTETEPETETKPTRTDCWSFFNRYLDDCKKRNSGETYKEKRRLVGRFLKRFKNLSVDEVDSEKILTFLEERADSVSNNAANVDRKNLLAMWNWGIRFLKLEENPVAVTEDYPHDTATQYTPPERDIVKLLNAATDEERVFLTCYLQTGGRRGEILRWRWNEDVDFEKRQVRLCTRKGKTGQLKCVWLPMNDLLYEELRWYYESRPVKRAEYVFVSSSRNPGRHYGKPFKERRWFMESLCKRAGIKSFGFHALRRYVASVLADKHKVSTKTIQEILRHENVSTTERYIQRIHSDLRDTVNLLSTPLEEE